MVFKNLKIGLIACAFMALAACEDNLQIEPPTSIDAAEGFKTAQDVAAALQGSYSSMQSANYLGVRYYMLCDMGADNITWSGTFPSFGQIQNRNILPDNAEITNMWSNVYDGINRINNVIESAPKIADKAFNQNAAIAEARAIRAYQYFNLLRFFGGSPTGYGTATGVGLPVVTTPVATVDKATPVERSSEADTWKLILDDLDFATKNLTTENRGTSGGRINKWAAFALKSRAHLYRGEWAAARDAADSVITKGGYALVKAADYGNIFTQENSSEAIWELQFDPVSANSMAFFYFTAARGGRNEVTSSTALNTAHEAADLIRKPINYVPKDTTISTGSGPVVVPATKTIKYTRVSGIDNVIMIRLAELYLIRAEAKAKLNDLAGAAADLNVVRNRVNLANTTAATEADLILAIERERRVELAHEGHRWFDLRRYNKISTLGVTQPFRALWPLPQREIINGGGKVVQNTGY